MSCGHGICGSDGMSINRVPALACQKLVKDYRHQKEILIEPLQYFPVIKDLVVDLTAFFQRIKAIHPGSRKQTPGEGRKKERKQTIEERTRFDDATKCILCACCMSACPVLLKEDPAFIGPAVILRAQRYIFDTRVKDAVDRMKIMDKPKGIGGCKTYFKCTMVCPKQIKVTKAIMQTKNKIFQELHPTS